MNKSSLAIIVVLAVAAGVAAFALTKPAKPDNTTPAGAVLGSVACIRDNDVKGLLTRALPTDEYAKMKKSWDEKGKMSDEEKAKFNAVLTQLTADKAEETIFGMVKPQLAGAQEQLTKAKESLGPMLGFLTSGMGVTEEKDQKQVAEMANAIGTWIGTIKIDDEAKIKQAIGLVCATVRSTGIKNADDLQALSFDQFLAKAGSALGGIKQVLDLYGLSINQILDSVKVGTPEVKDALAKVPVTFTVLGKTVTIPSTLHKSGDRWFSNLPK